MKKILIFLLLILPCSLYAQWTYLDSLEKVANSDLMRTDGKSKLFINSILHDGYIYSFDVNTNQFDTLGSIAVPPSVSYPTPNYVYDMHETKDGTFYASCYYDLEVLSDTGFVSQGLTDYDKSGVKCNQLFHSVIDESPEGKLYTTGGYFIFEFTKTDFKVHDLRKYGSNKVFFGDKLGFYKNYICYGSGGEDWSKGIDFLNLSDSSDKKQILFSDYGLADTMLVAKYINHKEQLYIHLMHLSAGGIPQYTELCVYENDKFRRLDIEYLDTMTSVHPIRDFYISEANNLVLAADIIERDGDSLVHAESQIIFLDLDGNLKKAYTAPALPDEKVIGEMTNFIFPKNLCPIKGDIYLTSGGYWHRGILKLTPDPELTGVSVVEDVEGGSSNLVWIFNAYPNPAEDKVYLDFFCMPTYFNDLKISLYDYTGREYSNISFNVLNYDFNSGHGKIQVDIGQVPKGIKYLQLKSKGETYTEGIVIK